MTLTAKICCAGVHGAARVADRLPTALDRPLALVAVAVIEWYRRRLSHRTGRCCMFSPSCSQRAIASIAQKGFRAGVAEASAQLRRCGGSYTLIRTCGGDTTLITADGQSFGSDQLSFAVTGRFPVPAPQDGGR